MNKLNTSDLILEFIEDEFGIPRSALLKAGRRKEFVKVRNFLVFLCIQSGVGYSPTGRLISRDHTTIIHSYNKVRSDKEILGEAEFLFKKFLEFKNSHEKRKSPILSVRLTGKYAYLYERFGGRCIICGFDEVVEVHHINPRKIGGDDSPENLILLCPNHHALADQGMLSVKGIPLINSDTSIKLPVISHNQQYQHP